MRIEELRGRAERVVPPAAWDYLETGAGTEISLGEAESAWHEWRFRPHVLRDVSTVRTECELLGTRLSTPILVAPTAYHAAYHSDAEVATATGAGSAGSVFCLSTRSSRALEDVGAAAGTWWKQVYVMADRDLTDAIVARAVAAGASALVLTGDTPYVSRRTRGDGSIPVSEEVAFANLHAHLPSRSWADLEQNRSITTTEITRLAEVSGLPVLVKGVLRADDAQACVDAGAAGVVVSNHGARQLDRALPTARALPEVVAAIGDQVPVLVDGGIRTGADVAVALALGAAAVLLGRPAIYALACGGAEGVAELLRALTHDTAQVMGLLGVTSLGELDRSSVVRG